MRMISSIAKALRNPIRKLHMTTTSICPVRAQTKLRNTCIRRSTSRIVLVVMTDRIFGTSG